MRRLIDQPQRRISGIKTVAAIASKLCLIVSVGTAKDSIQTLANRTAIFQTRALLFYWVNSLLVLDLLACAIKITNGEIGTDPDENLLSPFNHLKSANNLLIVSRGNWSKLICDFKGCRLLEEK